MFSGGTGTKEDPFLIATPEDLEDMKEVSQDYYCFKQIADIDFEGADWFNPSFFTGFYDGQNYKISNLNIVGNAYPSMFGAVFSREDIAEDGKIAMKNIRLVNVKVEVDMTFSAALAGFLNDGYFVVNCHAVNCRVDAPTESNIGGLIGAAYSNSGIIDCSVSGYVRGQYYTGALVGTISNNVTIKRCKTNTDLVINSYLGGGITGSCSGHIEECEVRGTLSQPTIEVTSGLGVLVGSLSGGTIERCTAYVDVLEVSRQVSFVGLVRNNSKVKDCYANVNYNFTAKTFSNSVLVGGIASSIYNNSTIENCYTRGSFDITTPEFESPVQGMYIGGIAGKVGRLPHEQQVTLKNNFSIVEKIKITNISNYDLEDFLNIGRIAGNLTGETTASNYAYNQMTFNGSTTFLNEDKTLEGKDGEDITIEQLKDKNTYIEKGWDFESVWDINEYYNDGFPHLRWESTEIKKIGPGDYIKLEKQNEKKVIKKVVSTFNFDGDDIVYTAGEGEEHETLKIENPFMTQDIVSYVQSQLNGFEYVPYSMEWRCYPQLEPGDFYLIETRKGEILETFIMSNKITFRGGLKADTNAPARSQQQSEFPYKGTLTKKIEHIERTRIVEGKDYYGVRTSRDFGLKIKREDGKSEVILNSDIMEFKVNDERKIYFDVQEELYKFTGKIIASMFVGGTIDIGEGTFTVDDEGKVTINSGSIIITREDGNARIVISEAAGITFQKWNEVSEDWEETIGLDSEGAGVITGGTLRTAKDGRRVEVSNNQIRCYNDDGKLNGFVTNNTSSQFGDWEFWDNGNLVFRVYNSTGGEGVSLIPENNSSLLIGSSGSILGLLGNIVLNGSTVDSLNTATAGPTYTATEQQMLQDVYDKLKELLDRLNNN